MIKHQAKTLSYSSSSSSSVSALCRALAAVGIKIWRLWSKNAIKRRKKRNYWETNAHILRNSRFVIYSIKRHVSHDMKGNIVLTNVPGDQRQYFNKIPSLLDDSTVRLWTMERSPEWWSLHWKPLISIKHFHYKLGFCFLTHDQKCQPGSQTV